jgi:vacuolar-type H+-ATPase subunit H
MTPDERAKVAAEAILDSLPLDLGDLTDTERREAEETIASAIRSAEVEARADAERARAEADARYCDLMARTERLVSEAADAALERAAKTLDRFGESDRNVTRKEVMYRPASVVRSLKSGGGR